MAPTIGTKRAVEAEERSGKRARVDIEEDEQRREHVRESLEEEPLFSDDEDDNGSDASAPEAGEEGKRREKKHWRPRKYHCDREGCDKSFKRPIQLADHKRTHDNKRAHVCPHSGCGKDFLRSEHMTRHYEQCHAEKTHICDYILTKKGEEIECGASFSTNQRLRRHKVAHDEKKKTEVHCPQDGCERVFRKQETCDKHVKIDHLREAKPWVCDRIVSTGDNIGEQCTVAYKSQSGLKRHIAHEHTGHRFLCQPCATIDIPRHSEQENWATFGFASFGELQTHMKEAHGPTCDTCGKKFENWTVLKTHIEIEHIEVQDRRYYICPEAGCGASFTRNWNMKAHHKSHHENHKAWVCGGDHDMSTNKKVAGWDGHGCGHACNNKASLEEHIRTKHMGLLGYQATRKLKKLGKDETDAELSIGTGMENMGFPGYQTARKPKTQKKHDTAIELATGTTSYEDRPHRCLVGWCQQKFVTVHQLGTHLELTHGWTVDDVNDQLERSGLVSQAGGELIPNDGQLEQGTAPQAVMTENGGNDPLPEDGFLENDNFYFGGLDEFDHVRHELEAQLAQPTIDPQTGGQIVAGAFEPSLAIDDGTGPGEAFEGLFDLNGKLAIDPCLDVPFE